MHVRLSEIGKTLATRQLASRIRRDVAAGRAHEVVLDFAGVLAISHSFADEFAAALISPEESGWPSDVQLANTSPRVRRAIDRAVEFRTRTPA